MNFQNALKRIGETLLENGEGCTSQQLDAYLGILRFFEYAFLAVQISANVYAIHGRHKSNFGTIRALFEKYS